MTTGRGSHTLMWQRDAKAAQFLTLIVWFAFLSGTAHGADWQRHAIDNSSRGADGVRLADVNRDGRMDVATGWEEGGVVRIYMHPGSERVREPWPMTEVGQVRSPEDAVFADVDGDGHFDVVSCCEGKVRSVFVHWNPGEAAAGSTNAGLWTTASFPQLRDRQPWMFCLPRHDDSGAATELFVASKGGTGEIGRLLPPDDGDRRDLDRWKWESMGRAGWVMSIQAEDIDGDGREDVVYSDRKDETRGIHWFKRPAADEDWKRYTIGGEDREVMFMDIADIDGDGLRDIISAVKGPYMLLHLRKDVRGHDWLPMEIPFPIEIGTGKAVAVGDMDNDGQPDLVCTCERAIEKSGVYWLSRPDNGLSGEWGFHDISGAGEKSGIKFDRIELIDLDNDGDLDVMTCEERDGLGVIWYENPGFDTQKPARSNQRKPQPFR